MSSDHAQIVGQTIRAIPQPQVSSPPPTPNQRMTSEPVTGVNENPRSHGASAVPQNGRDGASVSSAEEMIRDQIKRYHSQNGGFVSVMSSNNVLAALLSFVALFPFYMAIYLIRTTYLGGLFWNVFGVAITFFTFVAIFSLGLKLVGLVLEKLRMRKFNWEGDALDEIRAEQASELIRKLESSKSIRSLLGRRLRDGLQCMKQGKSAQDTQDHLQTQSDRDEHALQASFSTIRLIIWSLPILGFIGTVWGIGIAVDDFAGVVNGDADIDQIKTSLTGVTGGLATAFETTLLALVMSMIVMFPKAFMQKSAEELMVQVDRSVEQRLLAKVHDRIQVKRMDPQDFLAAFEDILGRYQNHWAKQCDHLAKSMGQHLSRKFQKQLEQSQEQQNLLLDQVSSTLEQSVGGLASATNRLNESQAQIASRTESLLQHVDQAGAKAETHLAEVAKSCERMVGHMSDIEKRQEVFVGSSTERIGQMQALEAEVANQVRLAATSLQGSRQVVLPQELQIAVMRISESAGPFAQLMQQHMHVMQSSTAPVANNAKPSLWQRLFPSPNSNSNGQGGQYGSDQSRRV